MYCAVPKVATKTLLTLMLYVHLLDIQRNLRNNWTNIDINRTRTEQTIDISTFIQDLRQNGIRIPKTKEPKSLDEFLQMYLHILQFGNINGTSSSRPPPNPWRTKLTYSFPYIRLFNLVNLSQIFSSSFTRIIFVRHPFERLASAYKERIATLSKDRIEPEPEYDAIRTKICYQRMWLKKPHERVYNDPCQGNVPSFEDFIRYILVDTQSSVGISQMDFHWQPYSSICQVCQLKYNFIGRYETFNQDFNHLIRYFNILNWIIQKKYSSSHLIKWNYQKFYFNLPNDLICQLIRLYEEDFRLFKYEINQYINRTDLIRICKYILKNTISII
ncbi:unnamed protein product [Adineta ricciae]|uniref:Carbohydrate sulfotransferase n=1 Tax=Adineta ricciae TaxID=249248 RepID=A0A815LBR0_ADIRI|nr:unnamed protein product [Adineta ricciae]